MADNYDESYRSMLSSFRIYDLQALLGAYNINKVGRKSELITRAFDMLRSRQPGFNRESYVAKIHEIHQTLQAEMSRNNVTTPSLLPRQQRQMMNMRQIQNPQQRMHQLPRYSRQAMHMNRAGLPQIQRGYILNLNSANVQNNIQIISGSYQVSGPRSIAPSHLSSNQQMKTAPQDGIQIDLTNESTDGDNTYVPSPETLSKIKFKNLPFYELTNQTIKPTFLNGTNRITLQSYPEGIKEFSIRYYIPVNDINYVTMNRDISLENNEYIYQFQIRIGQFEEPINNEITDCLPTGLHVRVNSKTCALPFIPPKLGVTSKRIPRPLNCTPLIKLAPIVPNMFKINWFPGGKNYVMCLNLVKKLTPETLIQRIIDKGGMSLEETKNYIIKKFGDVDQDLATTSFRFSLVCPLGKMRMKIPAKSIHCKHFQCFDVSTFILMNEKHPTWMCPTCNEPCLYDDIQIDNYFLEVVSSPKLKENSKEIEILADGTWIDFDENKEKKKSNTTHGKKLKPIETMDLDSDNENSDYLKAEPNPAIAKSQKTKTVFENLNLVDLTLSGDEGEQPKEKGEQENEAQASDAVQPIAVVDLEPQGQVQPQQAVTSSEQVEVIEIGTPSPPSSPTTTTEAS